MTSSDDAMDWIFDYVTSDQSPETMTATGAIIAGRRTYEVGQRDAGKETGEAYGGAWSGAQFVLTHRPPEQASDSGPAFLTGTVAEAVASALEAADGKNVEIFGGDPASQCLILSLGDEIVVHIATYIVSTYIAGAAERRLGVRRRRLLLPDRRVADHPVLRRSVEASGHHLTLAGARPSPARKRIPLRHSVGSFSGRGN